MVRACTNYGRVVLVGGSNPPAAKLKHDVELDGFVKLHCFLNI